MSANINIKFLLFFTVSAFFCGSPAVLTEETQVKTNKAQSQSAQKTENSGSENNDLGKIKPDGKSGAAISSLTRSMKDYVDIIYSEGKEKCSDIFSESVRKKKTLENDIAEKFRKFDNAFKSKFQFEEKIKAKSKSSDK